MRKHRIPVPAIALILFGALTAWQQAAGEKVEGGRGALSEATRGISEARPTTPVPAWFAKAPPLPDVTEDIRRRPRVGHVDLGAWQSDNEQPALKAALEHAQVLQAESLSEPAPGVHVWQRWEHALSSTRSYANPYAEVTLRVNYTGPDGRTLRAYGFWDGGSTFRIRCGFPSAGTWRWETECSDTAVYPAAKWRLGAPSDETALRRV